MQPFLKFGDPVKKKKAGEKFKSSETFLTRCPRCMAVNTVKQKESHSARSCPWCKHIFTPAHSEKRYLATGWDNKDSLTDWDGS